MKQLRGLYAQTFITFRTFLVYLAQYYFLRLLLLSRYDFLTPIFL